MTAEEIRAAVLKLWDDNGAWIPGGDYLRLAEALGVPPERTLTHRQGGGSRPSPGTLHHNIAFGQGGGRT